MNLVTVERRPTAVIARATTWADFPSLWRQLLDEVYAFVRSRPHLATGTAGELWQNVMLYNDQSPDAEVGVLVAAGRYCADVVEATRTG